MYQPKHTKHVALSGQKVPEDITRKFIEDYVRGLDYMAIGAAAFPAKGPLNEEEITHITSILWNIVLWYYDQPSSLGGFATYIIKNDLRKAVLNADTTNLRAIKIYALFMYNIMPGDYIRKGSGLA